MFANVNQQMIDAVADIVMGGLDSGDYLLKRSTCNLRQRAVPNPPAG